jgi:UDP-N-acetylmuramoyl-tripeptide--D-alanyl-D-alanine ligase
VASRDSFNTPMGFARTINEDIKPDTEILIMEMGARKRGDIREMCKLVKPQYGIITGIGPAHLETFKTIENIRKEKYVLAEYTETIDTAETKNYNTKLLGEHNQRNIALCMEIAKKLNVHTLPDLKPIPHRLELIETNNIKILDDSYNSNPVSAKCALDVLRTFQGKKLVQTPGFVEQGTNQYQSNYNLGKQIAAVADKIIIVGQLNKKALLDGIDNQKPTFFAQTREDAKQYYTDFDILLIENDIPNNY